MRRREILQAFGALALGGGIAAGGVMLQTGVAGVTAVLYKRLSYLELDRAGVRQFAREYVARGLTSAPKLRALSASRWMYGQTPQPWLRFVAPGMTFGEERIVSAFLLSSDFFPACNEGRVVQYLGFFDGKLRANPFARLVAQTT